MDVQRLRCAHDVEVVVEVGLERVLQPGAAAQRLDDLVHLWLDALRRRVADEQRDEVEVVEARDAARGASRECVDRDPGIAVRVEHLIGV
jgi:hypothetical protein